MKKVEKLTIAAMLAGESIRVGNTSVEPAYNPDGDQVGWEYKLHGNVVATLYRPIAGKRRLWLRDAGRQSVTTKSRLNAILSVVAPGFGITQRNWKWKVVEPDNALNEWPGSITLHI